MEQLEICKKQVIRMKVQASDQEMKKRMTARLNSKVPSAFHIDLEIKKNNLLQ